MQLRINRILVAKPGAQVMIRSQGARDIALGLGALRALGTAPRQQWP